MDRSKSSQISWMIIILTILLGFFGGQNYYLLLPITLILNYFFIYRKNKEKKVWICYAIGFVISTIFNILFFLMIADVVQTNAPVALAKGCAMAINNDCKPEVLNKNVCEDILCRKKVNLDNNGSPDTLMEICIANGITNSTVCLNRCGC